MMIAVSWDDMLCVEEKIKIALENEMNITVEKNDMGRKRMSCWIGPWGGRVRFVSKTEMFGNAYFSVCFPRLNSELKSITRFGVMFGFHLPTVS